MFGTEKLEKGSFILQHPNISFYAYTIFSNNIRELLMKSEIVIDNIHIQNNCDPMLAA